MIKKIFKKFGYMPIIEHKQAFDAAYRNHQKSEEYIADLFNFDRFKPERTYQEFCILSGKEKHVTNTFWSEYWNKYYRPKEIATHIHKLALEPLLLREFLYQFAAFDWAGTAKFMKETKWCYQNNKTSPTISELQAAVIVILPYDNFGSENNTISSGGFSVTLYYDENKPVCKIEFDKSLAYL
jgi:hypothetical protein